MDAYLKSTKPASTASASRSASLKPSSAASTSRAPSVKPAEGKARPYASLADASKPSARETSSNRIQGGVRDANKALINTLGKEDNPITNSTACQRTLHVQARRLARSLDYRERPLTDTRCRHAELLDGTSGRRRAWQQVDAAPQRKAHAPGRRGRDDDAQGSRSMYQRLHGCVLPVCAGVHPGQTDRRDLSRAGDDITNMQLRELVQRQGGKMVYVHLPVKLVAEEKAPLTRPSHARSTVPSARCTHVFIRENLSGSKAQKFLESNRKNGTKLVTPQWAIECARRGRRVAEAQFAAPVYNEARLLSPSYPSLVEASHTHHPRRLKSPPTSSSPLSCAAPSSPPTRPPRRPSRPPPSPTTPPRRRPSSRLRRRPPAHGRAPRRARPRAAGATRPPRRRSPPPRPSRAPLRACARARVRRQQQRQQVARRRSSSRSSPRRRRSGPGPRREGVRPGGRRARGPRGGAGMSRRGSVRRM